MAPTTPNPRPQHAPHMHSEQSRASARRRRRPRRRLVSSRLVSGGLSRGGGEGLAQHLSPKGLQAHLLDTAAMQDRKGRNRKKTRQDRRMRCVRVCCTVLLPLCCCTALRCEVCVCVSGMALVRLRGRGREALAIGRWEFPRAALPCGASSVRAAMYGLKVLTSDWLTLIEAGRSS